MSVSSQAVANNLRAFKRLVGRSVALIPVIKANAYGHGILALGEMCDASSSVHAVGVASLGEALELRAAGIRKPIVVLSFYDEHDSGALRAAILDSIRLPVYTMRQAQAIHTQAKRLKRRAYVHIKIDTGTSRIGILATEAQKLVHKMCSSFPLLKFEGIFSHFASSESNDTLTKKQREIFGGVIQALEKKGIKFPLQHIACSAAALRDTKNHFTAVRVGINTYGLHSVQKGSGLLSLSPALSWYTTIVHCKKVPKGTGISYGHHFITKRTSLIATIPVGYYDGYDRRFSNSAFVIVRGARCPIVGRVCMNLTMVDVTSVPSVRVGDTVTLLGTSRSQQVSADELAERAHTINYEIVTRIAEHIPRFYT